MLRSLSNNPSNARLDPITFEVIKNALSTYDEFSGDIEKVDSFNKTPPSAK